MKKPKKLYRIYSQLTHWDECGNCHRHDPDFLGETWAVSEAQAINNFCHRNGIKSWDEIELGHDESITAEVIAKEG